MACGKLIEQWKGMVQDRFNADKTPIHERYRGWETKSELMCPSYEIPAGFHDMVDPNKLDFKVDGLVELLVSGLSNYNPGAPIKARMAR